MVDSDRPAACRSAKNADTAPTAAPSESTSRHGSHRSPVPRSEPTCATTRLPRSRGGPHQLSSITGRNVTTAGPQPVKARRTDLADLTPELLGNPR